MKTPYDIALRVLQGEVDGLRGELEGATAHLRALEHRQHALERAVVEERRVSVAPLVVTTGYFARAAANHRALVQDGVLAAGALDVLRDRAAELYGRVSAIEDARDSFRSEQQRIADGRAQAMTDDIQAARLFAGRGRGRRAARP